MSANDIFGCLIRRLRRRAMDCHDNDARIVLGAVSYRGFQRHHHIAIHISLKGRFFRPWHCSFAE